MKKVLKDKCLMCGRTIDFYCRKKDSITCSKICYRRYAFVYNRIRSKFIQNLNNLKGGIIKNVDF